MKLIYPVLLAVLSLVIGWAPKASAQTIELGPRHDIVERYSHLAKIIGKRGGQTFLIRKTRRKGGWLESFDADMTCLLYTSDAADD